MAPPAWQGCGMSRVLRAGFALILALFSLSSHAVIPAQRLWWQVANPSPLTLGQGYSTPQAGCEAAAAKGRTVYAAEGWTFSPVNVDGPDENQAYHCWWKKSESNYHDEFSVFQQAGDLICPANSVPSQGGGCQCVSGYQQNVAGTACQASCNFGRTVSSGFFDYGAQVSGSPPALVCVGGCAAVFLGEVPAGSALVSGTKHYFAKGEYQTTGGTCTESSGNAEPPSNPDVPPDSCGPNQIKGVVNGKATCVWQQDSTPGAGDAGKPAPTNEPDKPSNPPTSSNTTINTVVNNNGSTTTTATTVTNNGNGTSTTTTTTTNKDPNGNVTGTSTTSETSGKQTDDQVKKDKCEKNSSDTGCGGAPKDISGGGLYTPKEATVKGVLEGARDTLMASPVGSAVTGFFSVSGGGSCPRSTGTIPFINATISIDAFCSDFAALAFLIIRGALLVVAGWMAFRIAVDN